MVLYAEKSFRYALKENVRVVAALVIRAAVSRFSKSRFGFIWVLAEPAAYLGIFLLIHTSLKVHMPFGDNALLFILAGIVGFRMTRGISSKTEKAIDSNLPMLTYPLVRPLDTIVATYLLETTIWLIICSMFMIGLAFSMDRQMIVYPGEFAECMLSILFFAFAFATFNATIGAIFPRYSTFTKMMSMPLMLLSGVFYMPAQMPPAMQSIMWWNPFMHCVEWFRVATYLDYHALLSREYLIGVSIVLLTIALILERTYRRRIMMVNI